MDTVLIKQQLRQIANMLLLNGTITDCPGLVHGKTGIAVFFFTYAQYADKELFEDYAMDLITEIHSQIHNKSLADYERGIAGIGVGVNYLIQNEFLAPEGNTLRDFDELMYRAVMYEPWQNFSFYEGLVGYGRYWITRLNHQAASEKAKECLDRILELIEEKLLIIPIAEQTDVYCFLHDIHHISGFADIFKKCNNWDLSYPRFGNSTIGNIVRESIQNNLTKIENFQSDLDFEQPPTDMGLINGYAGEGMLRLSAINITNLSWMNLL